LGKSEPEKRKGHIHSSSKPKKPAEEKTIPLNLGGDRYLLIEIRERMEESLESRGKAVRFFGAPLTVTPSSLPCRVPRHRRTADQALNGSGKATTGGGRGEVRLGHYSTQWRRVAGKGKKHFCRLFAPPNPTTKKAETRGRLCMKERGKQTHTEGLEETGFSQCLEGLACQVRVSHPNWGGGAGPGVEPKNFLNSGKSCWVHQRKEKKNHRRSARGKPGSR